MTYKNEETRKGYEAAMAISGGDTYMYDSTKRLFELAAKDAHYESASVDYKHGFLMAVYSLHRC